MVKGLKLDDLNAFVCRWKLLIFEADFKLCVGYLLSKGFCTLCLNLFMGLEYWTNVIRAMRTRGCLSPNQRMMMLLVPEDELMNGPVGMRWKSHWAMSISDAGVVDRA